MTRQFALSPDVNVKDLSHWFVLNTRLQKRAGVSVHLTAFDDFADFHAAIDRDEVDLVYANAADTAFLIRQKGFRPLAAPIDVADEATIVVSAEAGPASLKELRGDGVTAAACDAPDVERICRILLEPADLVGEAVRVVTKRNPVLVAKAVLTGEAKVGFLLDAAFHELSESTRRQLRQVATSRIYVVRHTLLLGPRLTDARASLLSTLAEISTPAHEELCRGLGAPKGWAEMSIEEAEFLIDLMETLAS